jgi:hypothetical protein
MFEFGVLFSGLRRRKRLAMMKGSVFCRLVVLYLAMTEKNAGILLAVRKW